MAVLFVLFAAVSFIKRIYSQGIRATLMIGIDMTHMTLVNPIKLFV